MINLKEILDNLNCFSLKEAIVLLPGNFLIGKGKTDSFHIEIHYSNNSSLFLQTHIDDVWSEDLIWGNAYIDHKERIIIYLCHADITIEKREIIIDHELNLSKYFTSSCSRLLASL